MSADLFGKTTADCLENESLELKRIQDITTHVENPFHNVLRIILKISQLSSKLRFSANCSFFEQSFSLGRYPPIYLPPKGVYLSSCSVIYLFPK